MLYFCFAAGIIILGLGVFFAYKKRYNTQAWISTVTFAVLLSVFVMILPTEWENSEGSPIGWFYDIISALQHSLKSLSGRQSLKQLNTLEDKGVFTYIYVLVNYIIYFITPILGTGLIISFVGDSLAKIRYMLPLFGKIVIFSELNESSFLVAKGLRENDKSCKVVFCNTKNADVKLVEKSRSIHAINLYKKCEEVRLKAGHDRFEFYLVSEKEEKNTRTARALIEKYAYISDKEIFIKAFIKSGPEVEVLESIAYEMYNPDNIKKSFVKQNISLSFFDKTELFCNNLVYEHPLYEFTDKKNKNISVMIVGCGETGMCMLKTVLWSGQLYGYKLSVRVYDKNADRCRAVFEKKCPELDMAHGYNVSFYSIDAQTSDFERLITENGQAQDATVAYVFTGDDDFNINTAVYLHGIFRKNRGFRLTLPIFTWINGSEKFASFSAQEKGYLSDRNIILAGNIESIYSEKLLFHSELEKLAFGVHLCYNGALDKGRDDEKYKIAHQSFINNSYNRRSSTAVAIHFAAKKFISDMWLRENGAQYADEEERSTAVEWILAENEHDRWNAFMRSEGYRSADIETVKAFSEYTKKDRDDFSKLHLCITPWENLDNAEKEFNALGYNEQFKMSDLKICQKISEIEDFAEKMKEDSLYV